MEREQELTQKRILHNELLKKQLTGSQIESLLNFFLFKSLNPILLTPWFKNEIAILISRNYRELKIKFSSKSREECCQELYKIFHSLDVNEILFSLKFVILDRGYFQEIIEKFLKITNYLLEKEVEFYSSLKNNILDGYSSSELSEIQDYFQDIPLDFLIKANKEVNFWFKRYIEIKYLISTKYYRLAYKKALEVKSKNFSIDKDCLFKSLILAIDTALNKYTSEKGTLTSYILLWFKSTIVNPKYDFEMASPYKMSVYAKNWCISQGFDLHSVSIEDENFEMYENSILPNFSFDVKNINIDLLEFLERINDSSIDLIKILLNIPKLKG